MIFTSQYLLNRNASLLSLLCPLVESWSLRQTSSFIVMHSLSRDRPSSIFKFLLSLPILPPSRHAWPPLLFELGSQWVLQPYINHKRNWCEEVSSAFPNRSWVLARWNACYTNVCPNCLIHILRNLLFWGGRKRGCF